MSMVQAQIIQLMCSRNRDVVRIIYPGMAVTSATNTTGVFSMQLKFLTLLLYIIRSNLSDVWM